MPRPITISHRSAETVGPGRFWRPGPPSLGDTGARFRLRAFGASAGQVGEASLRARAEMVSRFGEAGPRALCAQRDRRAGYSLLELVFAAGIVVTVSGMAAPGLLSGLDEHRTAGAARYISARMQRARMDAVMRSVEVAIQFTQTGGGYTYAAYRDGNHNGVRTRDIQTGADPPVGAAERLPDHFSAVDFGVQAGLPAVDGGAPPGGDPIRLGASNLASFSSNGTATSGSVYIRGRHAQYVVRLFGTTGKVRILKFDRAANQWKPL
jgi:type II secretory pathway pseudopilin PulG